MTILMLGNSFTAANHLPEILAERLGAEVVSFTRGGARLAEFLNPKTNNGQKTLAALSGEQWDYVVLQEMSNGPITSKDRFNESVDALCSVIREHGAKPVLYATWAYQRGGKKLTQFGMEYDAMYRGMYEAYHEAAERNQTLIADVGKRFYEQADATNLYAEDGCHPNREGTLLAAETIAEVIVRDAGKNKTIESTGSIGMIEVREINADETATIKHLFEAVYTETFAGKLPNYEEVTAGEKIYGAVADGRIVGFASVWEPDRFIHFLFVDALFRRQKVAAQLVASLAERYGSLSLKCLSNNVNALAFYRANGWKTVDVGVCEDGEYQLLRLTRDE